MIDSEEQLLLDLKSEKRIAFKALVYGYYQRLTFFANQTLKDDRKTMDIVDTLLCRLYEEKFEHATLPLNLYLYQELIKLLSSPKWTESEEPWGTDMGEMN